MGFLDSLFGSKSTKLTDQRTPQQLQMAALLQQLASTGSAGGINLGEAYTGSLGDYSLTQGTKQANANLASLFNGQDITKARETFTNLADTTFDPSDPKSGYAAFSRALAKSGKEAGDVINRESAITGSRFGTQIQGTKQDLAENLANQSAIKLAELYQNSRSSQLAGAQGLQGLVGTQANLAQQIAQQEDLVRQLKNQEAQAKYSEFQRQRGETLSRIDLLNQEASRNPFLGISEIPGQSPFSMLANSVLGAAGTAIGGAATGGISTLFSSLFSGKPNSSGIGLLSNGGYSGIGFSGGSTFGS